MAEYKLLITADETIEKLIFAGKEYINTWVKTLSGSKTLEKAIAMQVFDDFPEVDEELLEGIDDISSMYVLEVRELMERMREYEK